MSTFPLLDGGTAESIRIETDERGFEMVIESEHGRARFRISDPEALYDHVKAAIGPWLYERDMAQRTFPSAAFRERLGELWDEREAHSVRADIYDQREGK